MTSELSQLNSRGSSSVGMSITCLEGGLEGGFKVHPESSSFWGGGNKS